MMGVSNSQMTANESGLLPTLCHTAAYISIYFYTMLSKIHCIRTCVAYVLKYTAIKNQHSVIIYYKFFYDGLQRVETNIYEENGI